MPLPPITETGDLPQGVHRASLHEILDRFGEGTVQRKLVGMRLSRVYELAATTGQLKRFIVFGSFVSSKAEPNDLVFDHSAAQAHFGASIFWLRRLAALPTEEVAILGWQVKRDGTRRGVVEIEEREL